jgi:hypothetical protein
MKEQKEIKSAAFKEHEDRSYSIHVFDHIYKYATRNADFYPHNKNGHHELPIRSFLLSFTRGEHS